MKNGAKILGALKGVKVFVTTAIKRSASEYFAFKNVTISVSIPYPDLHIYQGSEANT